MPPAFVNETEIRVVGMSRSGNHAIVKLDPRPGAGADLLPQLRRAGLQPVRLGAATDAGAARLEGALPEL